MNSGLIVINISPREEECAVCDCIIVDGKKGIAMFEGEPVPHIWPDDWVGMPCCERCFAEFERVQAHDSERRVWFAGKRREARRRRAVTAPIYLGDL